jgi:hypothetical protein
MSGSKKVGSGMYFLVNLAALENGPPREAKKYVIIYL